MMTHNKKYLYMRIHTLGFCSWISKPRQQRMAWTSWIFSLRSMKVQLLLEEILWDKKYVMDLYRFKDVLSIVNSIKIHWVQEGFLLATVLAEDYKIQGGKKPG